MSPPSIALAIAFSVRSSAPTARRARARVARARSTHAGSSGSSAAASRSQIAPALAVESCCDTTICGKSREAVGPPPQRRTAAHREHRTKARVGGDEMAQGRRRDRPRCRDGGSSPQGRGSAPARQPGPLARITILLPPLVPAEAGTQRLRPKNWTSRVRGNERSVWPRSETARRWLRTAGRATEPPLVRRAAMPKILIEHDHFLAILPVVLDPAVADEHARAVCAFFAHDVPDFPAGARHCVRACPGWRRRAS